MVLKTAKNVISKHLHTFQNQSILLNHSIIAKLQKYFISKQDQSHEPFASFYASPAFNITGIRTREILLVSNDKEITKY